MNIYKVITCANKVASLSGPIRCTL